MPKNYRSNVTWLLTKFFKVMVLGLPLLLAQTGLAADKDADNRVTFQEALNYFGFQAGAPDGVWGRRTREAIGALNTCLGQNKEITLTPSAQAFLIESYQIAKAQQLDGSCAALLSFVASAYQCPAAHWTELFQCTFEKGTKIATVCGAQGKARYRFGRKSKLPDLILQSNLKDIYVPWMGVGRYMSENITFADKDVSYRVYTSLDRLSEDLELQAGIDVIVSNRIVASLTCDIESIRSGISEASNLLEMVGSCWDYYDERWGTCQKEGGWSRYVDGPVFPYEAYQLGEFFSPCEKGSEDSALQEEAYAFGLYLQELVRSRDLESLYDNVKLPLINGPAKKTLTDREFDDLFSRNWSNTILSIEPDCSPVGVKGYMLGRGLIWFDKNRPIGSKNSTEGWTIISINNDLSP
tara:strand:+ start:975 stop:2204 length:1230 start_codon:yes stop_codon:yes gene_type:complete